MGLRKVLRGGEGGGVKKSPKWEEKEVGLKNIMGGEGGGIKKGVGGLNILNVLHYSYNFFYL